MFFRSVALNPKPSLSDASQEAAWLCVILRAWRTQADEASHSNDANLFALGMRISVRFCVCFLFKALYFGLMVHSLRFMLSMRDLRRHPLAEGFRVCRTPAAGLEVDLRSLVHAI